MSLIGIIWSSMYYVCCKLSAFRFCTGPMCICGRDAYFQLYVINPKVRKFKVEYNVLQLNFV